MIKKYNKNEIIEDYEILVDRVKPKEYKSIESVNDHYLNGDSFFGCSEFSVEKNTESLEDALDLISEILEVPILFHFTDIDDYKHYCKATLMKKEDVVDIVRKLSIGLPHIKNSGDAIRLIRNIDYRSVKYEGNTITFLSRYKYDESFDFVNMELCRSNPNYDIHLNSFNTYLYFRITLGDCITLSVFTKCDGEIYSNYEPYNFISKAKEVEIVRSNFYTEQWYKNREESEKRLQEINKNNKEISNPFGF